MAFEKGIAGDEIDRKILVQALGMIRSERSNNSIDDLSIIVREFVELDSHARRVPGTTARYANHTADRAQHIATPGQPEMHGDLGSRLVRLLGLDEETAFVDVSSELRKHLIDCRVVDSHGHSSSAGLATVIILGRNPVALRVRFQTDFGHPNVPICGSSNGLSLKRLPSAPTQLKPSQTIPTFLGGYEIHPPHRPYPRSALQGRRTRNAPRVQNLPIESRMGQTSTSGRCHEVFASSNDSSASRKLK